MNIVKIKDSKSLIPIIHFNICFIDGKTRKEISKLYQKKDVTKNKSCYYLQKFEYHLKLNHKISLKEYCLKYLKEPWPTCPISNKEVGFNINGKGLNLSQFAVAVDKNHSESFRKSCERMSEERIGNGNPMFGRPAWNNGLTAETNNSLKEISKKRTGKKASQETRNKMKELRAKHPLKARHITPHSKETCDKMREIVSKRWADGIFNRKTSIEQKVEDFLNSLKLNEKFIYQYQIEYFSVDFAFPELKIAIEADGDYFHVNPTFYPNGPINAVQRRNFGRDKAKNQFLKSLGWTILRFWECEINSEVYKEKLVKQLQELGLC